MDRKILARRQLRYVTILQDYQIANDVAFLAQCLVFVESAKPDSVIKLRELRLNICHEDSFVHIVSLAISFHDKGSPEFHSSHRDT